MSIKQAANDNFGSCKINKNIIELATKNCVMIIIIGCKLFLTTIATSERSDFPISALCLFKNQV